MLEKRERREQEEWQCKLAEDADYITKQREAIEREKRFIRRQQKKEEEFLEQQQRQEEEYLEQQRRQQQLRLPQQLQEESTSLPGRSSAGLANEGLQSKRGAFGGTVGQPDSLGLSYDRSEDDSRLSVDEMTKAELEAEMRLLQSELLQRNKADCSFLSEDQYQGNLNDSDYRESEENVARRQVEFKEEELDDLMAK